MDFLMFLKWLAFLLSNEMSYQINDFVFNYGHYDSQLVWSSLKILLTNKEVFHSLTVKLIQ